MTKAFVVTKTDVFSQGVFCNAVTDRKSVPCTL